MTVAANRSAGQQAAAVDLLHALPPSTVKGRVGSRLRVNVCFQMSMVECAHKRHFYEGLQRCGKADVVFSSPGPGFDFTFDSGLETGSRRIALMTYDPHGLPNDFGAEELLDPRFLAMLSASDRALLVSALRSIQQSKLAGHRSIVEAVVSQRYHILAMNLDWPFRARLKPRLPPGYGYMRIGPRVPDWIFYPDWDARKDFDCFFLGAVSPIWYPLRARIGEWLASSGLRYEFHDARPPSDRAFSSTAAFDDHQRWYADHLRRSKAAPFCGSVFNICVAKYLEAMACGCLVLAPLPHDSDLLGFRDGWNMVATGPGDFADKIRYYLAHDAEREAIARRGADLARRRHVATAQAAAVVAKLEAVANGKSLDDIEAESDAADRREWEAQGL